VGGVSLYQWETVDSERLSRRLSSTQIVPYSEQYREQAIEVGLEMHRNSIYADLPFDWAKTESQLMLCNVSVPDRYFKLAVREGVLIGAMLGTIRRTFFCDELLAHDMGWWVPKSRRGQGAALKLLGDFEQWAREMGARKIMIGQSTEVNIQQTTKLYTHLGYRLIGFNTVKDLWLWTQELEKRQQHQAQREREPQQPEQEPVRLAQLQQQAHQVP
jgi:hypothetical protein